MNKLAKYLNRHIVGNVFDQPTILASYAADRSILTSTPSLVAVPETVEDVCRLARFADQLAKRDYRLPITVRGTGLDKTGAAIGDGLVISTEKLSKIEEIDVRGRLVRVQPGVTLGELNAALGLHGLCLPVEYNPRATLGGLIANCTNDDTADRYGSIFHYVERAEVVLANGDLVQFAPHNLHTISAHKETAAPELALYRKVETVLDKHADTVVDRSMRPFDAAGYANVTRVRQGRTLNLLPLLFASQGTLGIIADIILRVEVLPAERRHMIAVVPDSKVLYRVANYIHELEPCVLKIYDMRIVQAAAQYGNRPVLLENSPESGWLIQASFDYRRSKAGRKVRQSLEILPPGTFAVESTPENLAGFLEFNTALMSYLNDEPDGERLAVLDDIFLPNHRLAEFLQELPIIESALGLELALYGSFATSNYHVRPKIDYTDLAGRKLALQFFNQYSKLVATMEGSITGGSPEGRVKALATTPALSDAERVLYTELKDVFDPHNILNPEVKLGAEFRKTLRQLRTSGRYGVITP